MAAVEADADGLARGERAGVVHHGAVFHLDDAVAAREYRFRVEMGEAGRQSPEVEPALHETGPDGVAGPCAERVSDS